jgi:hypothetical protein
MSIQIILQEDEAAAVEDLLDKILTNKEAAAAVFDSEAGRRSARRVSMKLHWAKLRSDGCSAVA